MSKLALDAQKMNTIVALISAGCPRYVAARCVGCAPSTIARTAARDAAFSARLRKASTGIELAFLRQIRQAGDKAQHWRAAAWALERLFPDRYARRGPHVITLDQLREALTALAGILCDEAPTGCHRRIERRIKAMLRRLAKHARPRPARRTRR